MIPGLRHGLASSLKRRVAPVRSLRFLPLACCALLASPSSFAAASRTMSSGSGAHSARPRIRKDGTTLIVEPREAHTATVILIHGLGDTADGWIDVASQMFAPRMPHVKFILPTADVRPITLNGGYPMPGWYDIKNLSGDRKTETCDGIKESRERILKLIHKEEEKHGIKPERVVISGFSQGGAMSYYTGLTMPHKLAGLLVLSGYMPLAGEINPSEEAKKTPIMACHGDADGVVQLSWGKDGADQARAKGVSDVTFKVYEDLPHSADPEELEDALAFLQKVLPSA